MTDEAQDPSGRSTDRAENEMPPPTPPVALPDFFHLRRRADDRRNSRESMAAMYSLVSEDFLHTPHPDYNQKRRVSNAIVRLAGMEPEHATANERKRFLAIFMLMLAVTAASNVALLHFMSVLKAGAATKVVGVAIWAPTIFSIDRYLVAHIDQYVNLHREKRAQLFLVFLRGILSILLGLVITEPIVEAFFRGQVEQEEQAAYRIYLGAQKITFNNAAQALIDDNKDAAALATADLTAAKAKAKSAQNDVEVETAIGYCGDKCGKKLEAQTRADGSVTALVAAQGDHKSATYTVTHAKGEAKAKLDALGVPGGKEDRAQRDPSTSFTALNRATMQDGGLLAWRAVLSLLLLVIELIAVMFRRSMANSVHDTRVRELDLRSRFPLVGYSPEDIDVLAAARRQSLRSSMQNETTLEEQRRQNTANDNHSALQRRQALAHNARMRTIEAEGRISDAKAGAAEVTAAAQAEAVLAAVSAARNDAQYAARASRGEGGPSEIPTSASAPSPVGPAAAAGPDAVEARAAAETSAKEQAAAVAQAEAEFTRVQENLREQWRRLAATEAEAEALRDREAEAKALVKQRDQAIQDLTKQAAEQAQSVNDLQADLQKRAVSHVDTATHVDREFAQRTRRETTGETMTDGTGREYYLTTQQVRRGQFATVVAAFYEDADNFPDDVVIKRISATDPTLPEMLAWERERDVFLWQTNLPPVDRRVWTSQHAAEILAVGANDTHRYVISSMKPSGTLHTVLKENRTMFDVIAAVIAMLEGLAFAHDRGLLHLDAKCDNVVFDSDRPYWIDWGLAEFIKRPDYLDAAPQDGSVGSPFFSSPQQYTRSRGWKSRSSDVYSVAAVMYCLVTGMPPWTREVHYAGKVTGEAAESSWIDWLGELTAAQPALISTTVSGFPPSLEPLSALLSRKLDKVAKNRQRSDSRPAAEFATELREILTTHRSALRLLPVGAETNTYLAELTPDERTALLQGHLSNAAQVSSVFDNNRPRPVIAKQPDRVGHAASRTVEPEPAHRRGVLRRVFRRDKSPAEETISAAESVPTWVSNVRPVRPVASESDATPVQDRPPPKGPGVVGTPADVTDAKTAGEDAEETVSGFIPEDEAIAAFEEEFEGQPTFEDLAANQAKKPAKPSVTPVIPGSELDLKSVRVARGPDGQEEYRVGDPVVIPDPDATEPDPTLSD